MGGYSEKYYVDGVEDVKQAVFAWKRDGMSLSEIIDNLERLDVVYDEYGEGYRLSYENVNWNVGGVK